MQRDIILPEANRRAYERFHFAPAIRSNGLIICSGVIGSGTSGAVPKDAVEEFENAFRAIGKILDAADATFDNVVDVTSYHVGLQDHLAAFMQVRDEYFSPPWPTWTAIGVSELAVPGARVEIRVVASAK